jgi:methionine-rich copper-binding protein CopC
VRWTILSVTRLVLAAGLALALAGPGLGHANLVRSEPPADGVVKQSPQVIRALFSQELDPRGSTMNLRDRDGRLLASGGVDLEDLDRKTMIVRLKAPLGPGRYLVGWRALSAEDGDVTQGQFRFTIGRP